MRIGLVGCGEAAELRGLAIAGSSGRFRLVAVSDLDHDKASAFAARFGGRAAESVEALTTDPEVDVVVVSTPPSDHLAPTLAALAAGRPVLCEKPLAPDPARAREMVEAAAAAGLPLMCGFNHRFFPAISVVREAAQAGTLGRVDRVRAYAGHAGAPEFGNPWLTDRQTVGGGAVMDNGIHVLDLVRHLSGEIVEVAARVSSGVYGFDVEEHGALQMVTESGLIVLLEASWTDWRGYSFWVEMHGDQGLARAAYAPMRASVVRRHDEGRPRRRLELFPWIQVRERLGSWRVTAAAAMREELRELARVLEGEAPRIAATGEDGARAVEIAAAAYEASRSGTVVAAV